MCKPLECNISSANSCWQVAFEITYHYAFGWFELPLFVMLGAVVGLIGTLMLKLIVRSHFPPIQGCGGLKYLSDLVCYTRSAGNKSMSSQFLGTLCEVLKRCSTAVETFLLTTSPKKNQRPPKTEPKRTETLRSTPCANARTASAPRIDSACRSPTRACSAATFSAMCESTWGFGFGVWVWGLGSGV